MSDRDRVRSLLSDAVARVDAARRKLSELQPDADGDAVREECRAVERSLADLGERLDEMLELTSSEPEADEPAAPEGDARPSDDDADSDGPFTLEEQHVVSRLMQDTAVHLAVRRQPSFWEIRHRHTEDGQPSAPLRAESLTEVYRLFEEQALRRGSARSIEPRALTEREQRALADFRDIATDHPRAVRWEATKTEVDYVDRDGEVAGGKHDAVEFPPGELVGPIEHLKKVLG